MVGFGRPHGMYQLNKKSAGYKLLILGDIGNTKLLCIPSLLVGLLQSFSDQIAFHIGLCNGFDLPDTILLFRWDPGGAKLFHWLGGKPKLKKGGMSVYTLGLLSVAAHMKLVTHIVADTNPNFDMLVTTK
jgi:hypothetical protein